MNRAEKVLLSSFHSEEDQDELLENLDEKVQSETLEALPGLPEIESDDPFDFEVMKPRAIDLRRLYELAGSKLPPMITASLGPNVPLLLCHGITPFYKAGRTPSGVWGMGYEVNVKDIDAATVSLAPESRTINIANVDQQLSVGIQAGGSIGIPDEGLKLISQIPGISITGAEVRATTNQSFAIAIKFSISVIEIQAGPVGAGGARWNLYRGSQRIDIFQPLFHTILVPEGIKDLKLVTKTWLKKRGLFTNWFGIRRWDYPPQEFPVSLVA